MQFFGKLQLQFLGNSKNSSKITPFEELQWKTAAAVFQKLQLQFIKLRLQFAQMHLLVSSRCYRSGFVHDSFSVSWVLSSGSDSLLDTELHPIYKKYKCNPANMKKNKHEQCLADSISTLHLSTVQHGQRSINWVTQIWFGGPWMGGINDNIIFDWYRTGHLRPRSARAPNFNVALLSHPLPVVGFDM